jgi:serine/threonine protein kinase
MSTPLSALDERNTTSWQAGDEPIPGYRLLEPLGRGGFGEVWKCEAPGGLHKAIKFIGGSANPGKESEAGSAAAKELAALQSVKAVRHPFILSIDRVEVVDSVLVTVMELADRSLDDLLTDYNARGRSGIPRDELLGYLIEAAEALDVMGLKHGLQHLDVKPQNLFLVGGHVKVADFGLVHRMDPTQDGLSRPGGGFTPLYASPEVWRGKVSPQSDQYSLAVVYQHLLTGTLPFRGQNPRQLMLAHMSGEPDLEALPAGDREAIARALAKESQDRFLTCTEFLRGLLNGYSSSTQEEGLAEAAGLPSTARRLQSRAVPNAPPAPDKQTTKVLRRPRPPSSPEAVPEPRPAPAGATSAAPGDTGKIPAPPTPVTYSAPTKVPGDSWTAVALPGYRFLRNLGPCILGELWHAQDPKGNDRHVLWPLVAANFTKLSARVQELRHPALPETVAMRSPTGRVAIVTECPQWTLRDRFEECREQGMPGVPRKELLGYLHTAAKALDELLVRFGLQHLSLNPRKVLLDDDRLRLADFGLVSLIWLSSGRSAAEPNTRYAPPELFEGQAARTSDQYSLALIYAEMLNGALGRPQRGRPTGQPGQRSPANRQASRADLDLLPAPDRPVVARALESDPAKRFSTCGAFLQALDPPPPVEAAAEQPPEALPAVLPIQNLLGEPPPADVRVPSLRQVVAALAPGEACLESARNNQGLQYIVHPNGIWEYRCPIHFVPGVLPLKVNALREMWRGYIVEDTGTAIRLQIGGGMAQKKFWGFAVREVKTPHLAVEITAQGCAKNETRLAEVRVLLRVGDAEPDEAERILKDKGPALFESIRKYLQVRDDMRSHPRWPCAHALSARPILPGLEVGDPVEGICRDVSPGGVGFLLPDHPTHTRCYLHWPRVPQLAGVAVQVRIVRVQKAPLNGYEVGARFQGIDLGHDG